MGNLMLLLDRYLIHNSSTSIDQQQLKAIFCSPIFIFLTEHCAWLPQKVMVFVQFQKSTYAVGVGVAGAVVPQQGGGTVQLPAAGHIQAVRRVGAQ